MFRKRKTAAEKQRAALQADLARALAELRANEAEFRQSADACYTEQLIYQHAALMCRCRALLRQLRGGDGPCPPAC